jgi:hypothetical protein
MSSRKQRARDTQTPQVSNSLQETNAGLLDSRYQFASLMTLAYTLVTQSSTYGPITGVFALAGIGLSLYKKVWFWPAMFVAVLTKFFVGAVFSLDNHSWLYMYWILTLAIYSLVQPAIKQLQLTARLLIGFSFMFATAWKVLSPEFRSGSFFTYAGATEPRFTGILEALGLQQIGTGDTNLARVRQWAEQNPPAAFDLINNASLNNFWMALTVATIIIEALVAIAFIAPLVAKQHWWRDVVLAGFCIGTYTLMPVLGYGHLLCIMGYTQSNLEEKKRRTLYIGIMVFVQAMIMRDTVVSGLAG